MFKYLFLGDFLSNYFPSADFDPPQNTTTHHIYTLKPPVNTPISCYYAILTFILFYDNIV